ncbi:sensor histidine kinase [Nocardia sp. BMG111209]|uniref:sensor histidine kinase n=1 Tax=Nocardia sp. BMG111209 TaxID=1160137 RepID=UPI000367A5D0|nr:ATP-binding protein [Nocardia sp. BMG111209]
MTTAGAVAAPVLRPRFCRRAGAWWRGRAGIGSDTAVVAFDRIVRRLGLSVGLAGVIMGSVEVPEIAAQNRAAAFWWGPTAAVLAFGLLPILALISLGATPRTIRSFAGIAALCYLAALATMPFALHAHALDASVVWLYRMSPLGVLAAGLAWRLSISTGYLVLVSVAVALAGYYTVDPFTVAEVTTTVMRAFGLSALFLWAITAALGAAARVDRESALAGRRAAVAAAAAARDHEHARFAALIHDAVLSTLLDASRDAEPSVVLRRQAEHTLTQLDEIRVDVREPDVLDARSAVIFLRSAVQEVNPSVRFATRTWPGFDDLRMPLHTAATVAAALGEAVRNSLRHAAVPGRSVYRTVTCTISAGSIRLVFADDGAGFDVARIPADRLGVSVSILGRMRQLPGGAAFVESQPGEGTTVTLVWGGGGL